jgi:Na+/proline symporter
MMLIYLFVVWWAQHHADGGGYIAQRLCAAASPRDARRGMLWFTVANYVFRPWPWILIGLVSLALFPRGMEAPAGSLAARIVTDREAAYPLLMREFLPAGLLGLALAGMISAFMSTVDTHLNWGTSYLVNDLYARFLRPRAGRAEVIFVSRAAVLLMTLGSLAVAAQIGSIEWAWKFNVSLGAGLGLPVLLRWLWWRANAWTEVSGMVAAGLTTAALHWAGASPSFPVLLTAQVSVGGAAMLAATFLTQPVDRGVLRRFYRDALPPGAWGPVRERGEAGTPALPLAAEWALLSAAVFAGMFLAGALLVGTPGEAAGWAALLAASWGGAVLLRRWTGPSAAPA